MSEPHWDARDLQHRVETAEKNVDTAKNGVGQPERVSNKLKCNCSSNDNAGLF